MKNDPRPFILAEANYQTIQNEQFELAILPWGATEAHNYHLPYATDVIEADHIASEATSYAWQKGARVILLPTIPFGVNTGQSDIPLDINLNPSTQLSIIKDIVTVLNRQNINKLLIFNSHGGNDFKTMLREVGYQFQEMMLFNCNWFQVSETKEFFSEPGDHAGEMETSLILHLRPELVLPLENAGEGKAKKFSVPALNESWAWTERKWSQVTEDTGVGNPAGASAEKGGRFFEFITKKTGQLIYDLAITPADKLYIS